MLEMFLAGLHCTMVINKSYYEDGAYHGIRKITCPTIVADGMVEKEVHKTDMTDDHRALLDIAQYDDRMEIISSAYVKRPWYAPVAIFETKAVEIHDEKLAIELKKLIHTP